MKKTDKEKTSVEDFKKYFLKRGYSVKEDSTRVSGQKTIEMDNDKVNLGLYYYVAKSFYKRNESGEKETVDVSPGLTMYASGPGLLKSGVANLELKTIKYPHEEDIEKLEDYINCLLILLK